MHFLEIEQVYETKDEDYYSHELVKDFSFTTLSTIIKKDKLSYTF